MSTPNTPAIEIKSGVPIPPTERAKGRPILYPVTDLKPGDMFEVVLPEGADNKAIQSKRAAIYVSACRKGVKVRTRLLKNEDGSLVQPVTIGVWRSCEESEQALANSEAA